MKAEAAIKVVDNIRRVIPHRFLTLQMRNGGKGEEWEVIGWDRESRWSVAIPLDQPNNSYPIKAIAQAIDKVIVKKERDHEVMVKARAGRKSA